MVKMRLMRMGAKKRPFYRVVVADSRSPRDGRFIENIGKYHPLDDPSVVEIDDDRAMHWLRVGAQPTEQVVKLLRIRGIWDRFVEERPSAARIANPGSRPLSKRKTAAAEAPPAPADATAGA